MKSALSDEAPAKSGEGFVEGALELKSAGALAFGPDGVLFVGDSRGGAVYGLAVDDRTPDPHKGEVEINDIDKRIAKLLETPVDQVVIRDMAVNPATQHCSSRSRAAAGADAAPGARSIDARRRAVARPARRGALSRSSRCRRANEAAKTPWGASSRTMAITDLAFTNGELLIAGLSNEAFASTLRRAKFPFAGGAQATTVEIYHTSHGKYETAAPIEIVPAVHGEGQAGAARRLRLRAAGGVRDGVARRLEARARPHARRARRRQPSQRHGGDREERPALCHHRQQQPHGDAPEVARTSTSRKRSRSRRPRSFESFGTPYQSMAIVGVTQLDVLRRRLRRHGEARTSRPARSTCRIVLPRSGCRSCRGRTHRDRWPRAVSVARAWSGALAAGAAALAVAALATARYRTGSLAAVAHVEAIFPTADRLPANLLRFYIVFSAPMSSGEAHTRLRLVDDRGRTVSRRFPRARGGAVGSEPDADSRCSSIRAGSSAACARTSSRGRRSSKGRGYRLEIDAAWRDAHGASARARACEGVSDDCRRSDVARRRRVGGGAAGARHARGR